MSNIDREVSMLCIILGVRNTNYWSDQCARHRLLWSPRSLSRVSGETSAAPRYTLSPNIGGDGGERRERGAYEWSVPTESDNIRLEHRMQ